MKKALSFILIPLLLFSLCACNRDKTQESTEYIPNTEVEIAVAYIYNGKANIVTRPLNDTPLKSLTLACVYYDITGKQIGQCKMIDCKVTDNKNVTLWQSDCPEMAVYVDCVVYSTTDESDNVLTAERIDLWEQSVVKAFQIDTYRANLENDLRESAGKAVANPHVKLGSVNWQDLSVTVEMELLSDNIKSVYLFALWFDEDGLPVDTNTCSYCGNGESMVAHITNNNHNYIFQAPETAQSAKIIVQSIDFKDGTQWINPYCYEWILLNRSNAK